MALSELDMMNLWAKQLRGHKSQWERLFDFGYAIEAEVRKKDAQLIRQMLEVLLASSPNTNNSYQWESEEWAKRRAEAITKANTRLEELQ